MTEPPGEFMYRWIGLEGSSASRKRSWATMEAETVSSMGPLRHIILSWEVGNRSQSRTRWRHMVGQRRKD